MLLKVAIEPGQGFRYLMETVIQNHALRLRIAPMSTVYWKT
jgi:hypothetical protein